MPIISHIGARSWKVRLVYTAIFVLLIGGAVTMIYPFLLMLSGSVKSDTDFYRISPYPEYWFDDDVLFRKYAESKYAMSVPWCEGVWGKDVGSWRKITPQPAVDPQLLRDYLAWREECDMPLPWYGVGHGRQWRLPHKNNRLWRERMYKKFNGDIDAYARVTGIGVKSWAGVESMGGSVGRHYRVIQGVEEDWHAFKTSRPRRDRIITNLDGGFRHGLRQKYTKDIAEYNRQHETRYAGYDEIFLTRRAPAGGLQREEWEDTVREGLGLHFLRLDAHVAESYRRHLNRKYGTIAALNGKYAGEYVAFADVPMPTTVPDNPNAQLDWQDFIEDPQACPLDATEVYGPRQAFEQWLARRRDVPLAEVVPTDLPMAEADYHDALVNRSDIRWEMTTRNYKAVFNYVLLHGRAILNTLIYCVLAVGTALLVNPLAAYALSRYKPRSTYKILLFCMATMAFPGEVTMIPSFLLLKRFPLWPLAGGVAAFVVTIWLISRLRPNGSEPVRMIAALAAGIVVGVWAVPTLMDRPTVSLLNTFAALVLPGMANGFSIFLLKGFFDSLPQELYEAAELDGAGEWTKFWTLAMSLSKPILAVIALGAFVGAYSAFMMALIIIPDDRMWTLMVWIFQLQSRSHPALVFASLVVAGVPTFLMFVFCQKMIMRGIVVPTEK